MMVVESGPDEIEEALPDTCRRWASFYSAPRLFTVVLVGALCVGGRARGARVGEDNDE